MEASARQVSDRNVFPLVLSPTMKKYPPLKNPPSTRPEQARLRRVLPVERKSVGATAFPLPARNPFFTLSTSIPIGRLYPIFIPVVNVVAVVVDIVHPPFQIRHTVPFILVFHHDALP
jgi:hypothetical protein